MGGGHRNYNRSSFHMLGEWHQDRILPYCKRMVKPCIERFLILRNGYQTSLYSHLLWEPDYRVHNLSNLENFVI